MSIPKKKVPVESSPVLNFLNSFTNEELDVITLRIQVSQHEHYFDRGEARTLDGIAFIKKLRQAIGLEQVK